MRSHELQLSCGGELVAAYEEIRRVAVEHLPGSGPVSGMGILLSRGLAAWIDAKISTPPALTKSEQALQKRMAPGNLPGGLEDELVTILTAMSMSVLEEVTR